MVSTKTSTIKRNTKASGKMTKDVVRENTYMITVISMRVTGKMMKEMVWEDIHSQTEMSI